MPQEVNKMVVEFLLKQINPFYLDAYDTLASLEYPIYEYETLKRQLEDERYEGSGKLIRLFLGPLDMPLPSVESGMEKFHARLIGLLEFGKGSGGSGSPAGIPVPDIPQGGSIFQDHHIALACRIRARAAADACCARGSIEWLIRYLEFLIDCIESGGFSPVGLSRGYAAFMSRG